MVKLTANPISKDDFNRYVNACNRDYMTKQDTSYANISLEFKKICQKKIDYVAARTNRVDMDQEEMDMISLSQFMPIFRIKNPFFIYNDHLASYKMDCSKPGEDDDDMAGLSRME